MRAYDYQYTAEYWAERLRDHQQYSDGMEFVVREGQDTKTTAGFDWVASSGDAALPAPFAQVAAEVHALYRV